MVFEMSRGCPFHVLRFVLYNLVEGNISVFDIDRADNVCNINIVDLTFTQHTLCWALDTWGSLFKASGVSFDFFHV